MIYSTYQAFADVHDPLRDLATEMRRVLCDWKLGDFASPLQNMAAFYEVSALAGFTHIRPDFDITHVAINGIETPVHEEVVLDLPFGSLTRFRKAGTKVEPKVLVIAPMSGHFATLLRGTVITMLRDFDVYVTDWKNARDIPLDAGVFGLEDFTQYIIDFVHALGPQSHIVAVCQPTVSALAAVSIMAARKDPDQPASLTLMAGPIDVRVSPTKVNDLANEKPFDWFESKMIAKVPPGKRGEGRRVYPGFIQLAAFLSMNAQRHAKSFRDMFSHRVKGEHDKANAIRTFYEEYFAIMDLPGDFYLETIRDVFQSAKLPQGEMMFKGELVDPAAIRRTFLLTVEGEKDDICAVGQTLVAQDLCANLRPYMKSHHMQPGVGHYGVFNGRKWDGQIYPVVRNQIISSI
ncbi:MAG: poly(3-hydroxybutyrate) depolymerase [Hyphomicrobiales bacterium]|jgi:polyhydroxyalkanoate depolymerase|nr:poly(3-hydroxybutyrate) depolymerase [Hyphomicrobiales bacterium]